MKNKKFTPGRDKRKNGYPTHYFEAEDRCPSCGAKCNVDLDLDDQDYCNECRPDKPEINENKKGPKKAPR